MPVFSQRARQKFSRPNQDVKAYTLLLVDDEPENLLVLGRFLERDYTIVTAADGVEALALIEAQPSRFQVVIADQRMPRMSGIDLMEQLCRKAPDIKRIMLTAYADNQVTIGSINRAGVFRFLEKPFEEQSLRQAVRDSLDAWERERSKSVATEIVGNDPKLMAALKMVEQVADATVPVLLRGETGTGKELFARALYSSGERARKPFATIHCGALPETLFEAELFGHKRGAFTGAMGDRAGRVSSADGGTLFFDEIAEIPMPSQAKLLRFFQYGEFQRVGSDRLEQVDVRIVAATHKDLPTEIAAGRFREDLYYRLNVVEITIPPLRERREDIPLLVETFLSRHWRSAHPPEFLPEAQEALMQHEYPGNVRELEHLIQRICLLHVGDPIGLSLFPTAFTTPRPGKADEDEADISFPELTNKVLKEARQEASRRATDKVERRFLEKLMATHGNISSAARGSGLQRTYLHRLLRKHDLN